MMRETHLFIIDIDVEEREYVNVRIDLEGEDGDNVRIDFGK